MKELATKNTKRHKKKSATDETRIFRDEVGRITAAGGQPDSDAGVNGYRESWGG
jgi:hypothetical protein